MQSFNQFLFIFYKAVGAYGKRAEFRIKIHRLLFLGADYAYALVAFHLLIVIIKTRFKLGLAYIMNAPLEIPAQNRHAAVLRAQMCMIICAVKDIFRAIALFSNGSEYTAHFAPFFNTIVTTSPGHHVTGNW